LTISDKTPPDEAARGSVGSRVGTALLAGYPAVFRNRAFRSLFIVLLLAGTASGMAMAYVSVWASETFGLGPQGVAFFFVVSGLAGAIGNPALGLISDRIGRRRPIILGQLLVTSAAFVGYTQVTSYPLALGLVAFSGFGVMGLVLAMVHDLVRSLPEAARRNAASIVATERTAWSIGIILGPVSAAAIVTMAADTRPVFAAAALTQIVAAILVWRSPEMIVRRSSDGRAGGSVWTARRRFWLVLLVGALILLTLPAQTRTMFLPLFVTQVLGEARGAVGPLFTLNAMVAVAMMPHVGSLADRFGAQRILYAGAAVGILYCSLQSIAVSYNQTMAIQVLIGFGIALWSTSTLLYLQRLLPGSAGAAGGVYLAVQQLTPVVSGLLLGPIAEVAGIASAFSTTAILVAISVVAMALAHRALARTSGATT
jgi:MFS family permease